MATRMVTAAAVALALLCPLRPAQADTHITVRDTATETSSTAASLVVGAPTAGARVDEVKLDLRSDARGTNATLTLVLKTWRTQARDVELIFDVPSGTRAAALSLTMAGSTTTGQMLSPRSAANRYDAVINGGADPALLEWRPFTPVHDRLSLRVFPLVQGKPATVTIEMFLPVADALTLEAPPRAKRTVTFDGTRADPRHAIALPPGFGRIDFMTEALVDRFVDGSSSLFADAPSTQSRVPVVITCGGVGVAHSYYSPDKKTIRQQVRLSEARLRRCYMQQAQRDPSLAGSVDMHFTIGADGRLHEITVDGALPNDEVKRCIADDLATWSFPPSTIATRVNYPLAFRLAQ